MSSFNNCHQKTNGLIGLFLLFLFSSCGGAPEQIDTAFGGGKEIVEVPVPVDLQITVSTPSTNDKKVGYTAKIGGGCIPSGTAIIVEGDGTGLGVCGLDHKWSVDVDFSQAPVGPLTVRAFMVHGDDQSAKVSKTFIKSSSDCDTEVSRSGTFASLSAPWSICTAQQFDNIRTRPADAFEIKNDIDFQNVPFNPIPGPFSGSLEGNNYTLSRLYINQPSTDNIGVFKEIKDGSTIQNLNLEDITITGRSIVAGLVGQVSGTGGVIKNVNIDTISINAISYWSGALVGRVSPLSTLDLENVNATNATIIGALYVGGILGGTETNSGLINIDQATSSGSISGVGYIGGIAGYIQNNVANALTHLSSSSAITTNNSSYAAGIVGYMTHGFIHDCTVSNTITSNDSNYLGGVAGEFGGTEIKNCDSTAQISVNASTVNLSNIGGIVGRVYNAPPGTRGKLLNNSFQGSIYATGPMTAILIGGVVGDFRGGLEISNNTSEGTVYNETGDLTLLSQTGGSYVGGLAGRIYADPGIQVLVDQNSNAATVTNISAATSTYTGGFAGRISTTPTAPGGQVLITNNTNTGNVTGTNSYVGGFAGDIYAERYGGEIEIEHTHNLSSQVTNYQYGYTTNLGGQSVRTTNYIGGFAGSIGTISHGSAVTATGITITDSHNTAHVTAEGAYVGGYAGIFSIGRGAGTTGASATLTDVFSTGNVDSSQFVVTSNDFIGGLIGQLVQGGYGSLTLSGNTYATGHVTGYRNYVGGLIGQINTTTDSVTNIDHVRVGSSTSQKQVKSLTGSSVGGLIGGASQAGSAVLSIQDSKVYTDVSTDSGSNVGGFIGSEGANITISDSQAHGNVTGMSSYIGGFTGGSHSGNRTYSDCSSQGTVTVNVTSVISELYVGGFSGRITGAGNTMDHLFSTGDVIVNISGAGSVSSAFTAGLIGRALGPVSNSFALGNVFVENYGAGARSHVGGLIGYADTGTNIDNSFAMGNVQGYENVGGLIGYARGVVNNSFSNGNVTGNTHVGGLIGNYQVNTPNLVNNVYATGAVIRLPGSTTINNFGQLVGLCGNTDALVVNGFYNTETSIIDSAITSPTVKCNTDTTNETRGLTTTQMEDHTSYLGFDFAGALDSSWRMPQTFTHPVTGDPYPYPVPYWLEN